MINIHTGDPNWENILEQEIQQTTTGVSGVELVALSVNGEEA